MPPETIPEAIPAPEGTDIVPPVDADVVDETLACVNVPTAQADAHDDHVAAHQFLLRVEPQVNGSPVFTCQDRTVEGWIRTHRWKTVSAKDIHCELCFVQLVEQYETMGRNPLPEA